MKIFNREARFLRDRTIEKTVTMSLDLNTPPASAEACPTERNGLSVNQRSSVDAECSVAKGPQPSPDAVRLFNEAMQSSAGTPTSLPLPSDEHAACTVTDLFDAVKPNHFERALKTTAAPTLETPVRHDLESGKARRSLDDDVSEKAFQSFPPSAADVSRSAAPIVNDVQAEPVPIAAPSSILQERVLDALVSRLLVSSPDNGPSEVRLTLSDASVLRGTDITLARQTDGALRVTLAADNPAAFQTLVAARSDLVALLQATEKQPVTLTVRRTEDDDERGTTKTAARRSSHKSRDFAEAF